MSATVHLEIPSDDTQRVGMFYARVMGWELKKVPNMDYTMVKISEGDGLGEVTGGIMPRRNSEHKGIMPFFGGPSVVERLEKVPEHGGKILMKNTAVPGYGDCASGRYTERNTFAMWEEDKSAK